jgi:2,4-dienoyl-CoA reductase-like NADH-dependent reductase (Old Yellow Enzyme family)
MATELASEKGEVTEGLIQHYSRRSKGPGLAIVEHSYVSAGGRLSKNQLGVYDDSLMPGLSSLAEAMKKQGSVATIQINHAGAKSSPGVIGTQPVAPSPVPLPRGGDVPRELSVSEIEEVVEQFVAAASRVVRAGFDAVEVHGAHGFLLNQFTSPLTNRRTDQYGGSLENRTRFPLDIVRRIRDELGEKVLLLFRLGADDKIEGGLTLLEGVKIAEMLESAGVDIIDISGGHCGSRPDSLDSPGFFLHMSEAVKSAVSVPVIGVGGVTTSEFAELSIRQGKADLIAVGRAYLKDPDWGLKAIKDLSS